MLDATTFDVRRFLPRLALFGALGAAELDRLAANCRLRRFQRGDRVFRAGERCDGFHVALTGQVKLYALSSDGAEKVIEIIGPGRSFAEAMVFLGGPYPIHAQTLAEVLLLTVPRQVVLDEVVRDPGFSLRMLAGLSRRLHGLVHDVQAQALQSGVQRVIGYLLREIASEASDGGPVAVTVSLPVSKATIASRLSLTPEYFSRVLRELEQARLIEVDRRDIRIPDRHRLARYPEDDLPDDLRPAVG